MTFVLDASAVLRYIDNETGTERMSEIFEAAIAGRAQVVMPAVNYGEVIGISFRRGNQPVAEKTAAWLEGLGIQVIPANAARAARSAIVHVTRKVPYADSFAVDLAADSPEHRPVTADFDFKLSRARNLHRVAA